MAELAGNVTIVTGASEGIGAEIAFEVARQGGHVVIGCDQREGWAQEVAALIFELSNGDCFTQVVAADPAEPAGAEQMMAGALDLAQRSHGQLAALVLGASAGKSRNREQAAKVYVRANLNLACAFSDAGLAFDMLDRRDVLYLTNHPSHFFGHLGNAPAVSDAYFPVAASRHDAEAALRRNFVQLQPYVDRRLLVLSGDFAERTAVDISAQRFGALAVRMLLDEELPNGHIRFVPRPTLHEDMTVRPASSADLSFDIGNDPSMYSFMS